MAIGGFFGGLGLGQLAENRNNGQSVVYAVLLAIAGYLAAMLLVALLGLAFARKHAGCSTRGRTVGMSQAAKGGYRFRFKNPHFAPALDNTAKIRVTTRPLTLQEFPARVLMQCMGRAGPNLEQITRDLEALLSGQPVTAAAPGAGGGAADAGSLDMTKTT